MRLTCSKRATCLGAIIALAACERPSSTPAAQLSPTQPLRSRQSVPPVADSAMGSFSRYAQVVVAGLGDSATRMQVWREMNSPNTPLEGIDLQSCGGDAVVDQLLAAGERRGGRSADAICTALKQLPGAILYMDRDRLKQWDGTSVPLVTAIEQPESRLPARIAVYRSMRKTMAVPSDGSTLGPTFVILPYTHPRHQKADQTSPPANAIQAPPPVATGGPEPLPSIGVGP